MANVDIRSTQEAKKSMDYLRAEIALRGVSWAFRIGREELLKTKNLDHREVHDEATEQEIVQAYMQEKRKMAYNDARKRFIYDHDLSNELARIISEMSDAEMMPFVMRVLEPDCTENLTDPGNVTVDQVIRTELEKRMQEVYAQLTAARRDGKCLNRKRLREEQNWLTLALLDRRRREISRKYNLRLRLDVDTDAIQSEDVEKEVVECVFKQLTSQILRDARDTAKKEHELTRQMRAEWATMSDDAKAEFYSDAK